MKGGERKEREEGSLVAVMTPVMNDTNIFGIPSPPPS